MTVPLTAAEPIPATLITLENHPRTLAETMDFFKKQSGLNVDVSKVDGRKLLTPKGPEPQPFWSALERIASHADGHVGIRQNGAVIELLPGASKAPASIDGPFRVVATGVVCRIDLATDARTTDVQLELHWEPRFPVFRVESQPTITTATDNLGRKLAAPPAGIRAAIGDRYAVSSTVRLNNIARDATSIALLEGVFTVTASPKMLAFTFKDGILPQSQTKDGVSVTLAKSATVEGRQEVEINLDYPETHPDFESFESWTDFNKLRLISADRTKTLTPDNFSINGRGRRVSEEYRFLKPPAAGASFFYETPAPLVEFPVKFVLKNISLP